MGPSAEERDIRAVSFSRFIDEVRHACNGAPDWEAPRTVTYLRSYLSTRDGRAAGSLLIEPGYVDRHYLQEFSTYYATTLSPPAGHTVRIHVFDEQLAVERVTAALQAASANYKATQERLNSSYLGFISIRPLPSAPIGRTVLAHYGATEERRYDPALTRHKVHLLGFELSVEALPFHQQEQGVGACATAALWSALARATRASGSRAPTPFSVTAAATKHLVTDRDLPASGGLELSQLTGAVREMGFAPYTVKPHRDFDAFALTLKCYLRSGIPAVLMLQEKDEFDFHAVAVAGYKSPASSRVGLAAAGTVRAQSTGITRLYVHDDRIGPYVKMQLEPPTDEQMDTPHLRRIPVDADSQSEKDPSSRIYCAIFPLYPKLRLTGGELINLAGQTLSLFRQLTEARRRDDLRFECWFALNGEYLRDLWELGVKPASRIEPFLRRVRLSRYVGIIRWYLGDEVLADVLCDTTDIARFVPRYGSILAVIPFPEQLVQEVRRYAEGYMPRALVM